MPWVATYTSDTEIPDTGTVVATWTDMNESLTVGPDRVESKAGLVPFVAKCKAALTAYRTQQAKLATISAKITAALNAP